MPVPQPRLPTLPATRRAPFAENPAVGERGTRTQRRILQAALEVFGEVGYHDARVETITAAAGCSRPTFYQYFSSKEDLFRQLAGNVARSLSRITDGLGPVTADGTGRDVLRGWLDEYSHVYDSHSAVFNAYTAASGSDVAVATGAARVARRQVTTFAARIDGSAALAPLEELTPLLFHMVVRTNRYRHLLERLDGGLGLDRARVNDALASVIHRSIFGPRLGVNVIERRGPVRRRRLATAIEERPAVVRAPAEMGRLGRETRDRLVAIGRQVFAARGYHDTRVSDIVALAETSHGTFYRYFASKHDLFQIVAARAGRRIVDTIDRLPDVAAGADEPGALDALRTWVDEYTAVHAVEGPIIRVWVEAMSPHNELGDFSGAAIEAARSRLARFLAPRGFGDVDAESLVLLALIDRERWAASDAPMGSEVRTVMTDVIARGFLGADGGLRPPS